MNITHQFIIMELTGRQEGHPVCKNIALAIVNVLLFTSVL